MRDLARAVEAFALGLGGPGLFLIAFLDSSFLSLPQANDILVVWMVLRHKERMLYYATMATLGSVAGCLVIYALARKGGEALLRRRVSGPQVDRALSAFRKYGLLAIIVPALLPPPAPFKLFVLSAGVAGMPLGTFTLAVAIGRGARYFLAGILTVWYGDAALDYLRAHGATVSAVLVAVVVMGGVAYYALVQRRRRGAAGAGGL
jgi:membrane protein YqaA with SNARE-associated domain